MTPEQSRQPDVWLSPLPERVGSPTLGSEPGLVWAAAGSLNLDRVEQNWKRRGALADLADVSGPWGVVLWDPAGAQFVAATDPLGIQPLFWARTSTGRIAVSSRLASLADRHDVDDSLDDEGVVISSLFHLWSECVADRTSFTAIRRIPWGRALRIGADATVRLVKYWNEQNLPAIDDTLTLAECVTELRGRIDTAIGRSLVDATAVGAHVSGGVDSSAVACRANQLLRAGGREGIVAGYSWSPDESAVGPVVGDERALLEAITAAEGFPIRLIAAADPDGGFGELDPDRYPWTIITSEAHVLPKAAADGVQVMLTGFGGDEAASYRGGRVNAELARAGRLDLIARQSWAADRNTNVPANRRLPHAAKAILSGVAATLPPGLSAWARPVKAARSRQHDARVAAALRGDFPAAAAAYAERTERRAAARTHRDLMIARLTEGYLQERINSWYQRGQLFGMDYRYPLLDLDVVTAAVAMPGRAFATSGWTRLAFRMAIGPWVPAAVAWLPTKAEPARMDSRPGQPASRPGNRDARLERLIQQTSAVVRPLTKDRPARPLNT